MPQQTAQQRANTYAAVGMVPPPVTTPLIPVVPPTNATINPAILNNPTQFNLPPIAPLTNYPINAVPNGLEQATQNIAQLQNTENPYQNQESDLNTRLLNATLQLGGQEAATIRAEDQAANQLGSTNGLAGFNTQLTDVNNQIQTLQKEAAALPLQIQEQFSGRGATAGGVRPIEVGQQRQNTIRALGLSAIAQTIQGNIASAQATAERAVKLEFEPKQAQIDFLKLALQMNDKNLERFDKKATERLAIELDERQRLLDNEKEDKKIVLGWVAEAAKNSVNPAPALVVNQAMAETDPNKALAILAPYMNDPYAKQAALLDLEVKRANIRQSNASTNASNASAEKSRFEMTQPNAGKPATEAQQTSANYASRLVQADEEINKLTSSIMNQNQFALAGKQALPSFLQGSDLQVYNQAKRNFINAVLRKESGAVIADSEFANAEQQYFPQPNDKPEVLASKAANRDLVKRNFINASGPAYEAPPSTTGSAPKALQVDGKTLVLGTDGKYYAQ